MIKRRDILRSLLAAPFLGIRAARAAPPPNIVMLVLDDATVEQIGRMPNAMKLGSTGVMFLNNFCPTAICQSGRATLLTGQMAHNHGILDNQTPYASTLDATTMLAARLQAAGYQTGFIGKYMNTYVVTDGVQAGWNEWHAISPQSYYNYSINDNGAITAKGSGLLDYYTTVCNDRALSLLGSLTPPFFVEVCYKAPHYDQPSSNSLNATPAPAYAGVIPTSRTAPRNPNFNVPMGTPPNYMAHSTMDTSKIADVDAFWRGSTEALFSVDRSVQAIVAALTASGAITNTVIIFTSDNGYFRGEGRDPAEKVAPYMPAIRVPLIISGPASLVAQGKVCSRLVSQADIAATIYALSGATSTRALDGASLASLLIDPNSAELRNYLLLEWLGFGNTGWNVNVPINRSIVTQSRLYTAYSTGEEELYDLSIDPWTLTNVVGNPAYAADRTILASKIRNSQSCAGNACVLM